MSQSLSDIAKAAQDMGQPLPDLESAIADLQSSQMDSLQRDLDAATTDLNKLKEMAQALQKLQQQADHPGKDLPEQLQFGQAEAAQGTLKKMIDRLNSGDFTPEEAAKTLDEVARSVEPAAPYGKASDFLKQAAQQLRAGEKPGAAQSLASASKELEKIMSEMGDAKALSASLAALKKAEACLGQGRGRPGGGSNRLKAGTGSNGGVGGWTPDDSTLYPEMSASWDNTGVVRPDTDPRGLTDRGEAQLAENLNPTKLKGQLMPGRSHAEHHPQRSEHQGPKLRRIPASRHRRAKRRPERPQPGPSPPRLSRGREKLLRRHQALRREGDCGLPALRRPGEGGRISSSAKATEDRADCGLR